MQLSANFAQLDKMRYNQVRGALFPTTQHLVYWVRKRVNFH
jgi:hypothetical protein